MKEEVLFVFNNTHDSIKADNACLERKFEASLIPTHPSITQGCGFMMKVDKEKYKELLDIFKAEKIEYKAMYNSIKKGIKREITPFFEINIRI